MLAQSGGMPQPGAAPQAAMPMGGATPQAPMAPPAWGAVQDALPIGGNESTPASLYMAQVEAQRRAGGAMRGTQAEPPSPFSVMQLARLGVSEAEMELMRLAGGLK
jgi:hypothetical protein